MSDLRFILIIPFYNAHDYLQECLDSVIMQTHRNWLAVCADDHSEDGSSDLISEDSRLIKRNNNQRLTGLPNIYQAITSSGIVYQDDDVICILDGDDKFLHPYSLSIINEIYNSHPGCLLTYGQYMTSNGRLGHCREFSEWEFESLREGHFWVSHLKTFKWKLYREFLQQDPGQVSYKGRDGIFFTVAYDIAIMYPLLEIAGFDNIRFNKHPVYWYRIYDKNDSFIDLQKQRDTEMEIRSKPRFKRAFTPVFRRSFAHQMRRSLSSVKHRLFKQKDRN